MRSSAGRGAMIRGGSYDGRTAETALKEKTWPGWSVVIYYRDKLHTVMTTMNILASNNMTWHS
jgi:hypothetical protein